MLGRMTWLNAALVFAALMAGCATAPRPFPAVERMIAEFGASLPRPLRSVVQRIARGAHPMDYRMPIRLFMIQNAAATFQLFGVAVAVAPLPFRLH